MTEADEARLCSPRLFEQSHYWHFDLHDERIRGASLCGADDDPPGAEAVDALFADPRARDIEWLRVEREVPCRALVAQVRPTVRRLTFGVPALAGALRNLPGLEHLELAGRGAGEQVAEDLALPRLRSLKGRLSRALVDRLAVAAPALESFDATIAPVPPREQLHALAHPRLRELTCSLAPHDDVDTFALPCLEKLTVDLEPATLSTHPLFVSPPPALATVRIAATSRRDLVPRLSTLPVARQIRELAIGSHLLGRTDVTDDAVLEGLVAHARAFPVLARVEIGWAFCVADDVRFARAIALTGRCEGALPGVDVRMRPPMVHRPEAPTDARSRGPDGTIEPLATFMRHARYKQS